MAREDLEEWADDVFLGRFGLAKRKTFSCPSYYLNGKMFAFLYHDALGVKLPPEQVLAKIAENRDVYAHFNPGDGVMKNWLMITYPEAVEYDAELPLIEHAFALMQAMPLTEKKKPASKKKMPKKK